MKNEKGITLGILVITVVVMLIIVGISAGSAVQSIDKTKLKGFYSKLEVVQKRVDEIAYKDETYKESNVIINLKTVGPELNNNQKAELITALQNEGGIEEPDITNFKYFTMSELDQKLDLADIGYNMYIDFDNRIVVAEGGINIGNTTYHMLKTKSYFIEKNSQKNVGTIQSLSYSLIQYGTSNYKVNITPSNNIGDITQIGNIKYKKSISKYWESSNNGTIIIESGIDYDIIYEDINKNNITKKIKIVFNENSQPVVSEIQE